jgi:hypothetical protein
MCSITFRNHHHQDERQYDEVFEAFQQIKHAFILLLGFSTSMLKSKRALTQTLRCRFKRPVHHPECF